MEEVAVHPVMVTLVIGFGSAGNLWYFFVFRRNTAMQKFLKTMFSITVFAGIVLIAAGAASLIRTIVSMSSGEQARHGALGKGIGLLVGGAVLCALQAIVTAIIGSDPTTMTFY